MHDARGGEGVEVEVVADQHEVNGLLKKVNPITHAIGVTNPDTWWDCILSLLSISLEKRTVQKETIMRHWYINI